MKEDKLTILSEKEALIIKLLIDKEESLGLEVFSFELVKLSSGILKRGTIYVTLNRMIKKEYVTFRRMDHFVGIGHPKKMFKVTELGKKMYNIYNKYYNEFKNIR